MLNKLFLLIFILFIMAVTGTNTFALNEYGKLNVIKGGVSIIRDGVTSIYDIKDGKIVVLKNDVMRVGASSSVILKTVENTTIKMGSNAVFEIRPWKRKSKFGYLRMLFGKSIFQTKKRIIRKRFRIRTATATIGVKGTVCSPEVSSNGNTSLACQEGTGTMTSPDGVGVDVPANTISFAFGGKVTKSVKSGDVEESSAEESQEEGDAEESQEEGDAEESQEEGDAEESQEEGDTEEPQEQGDTEEPQEQGDTEEPQEQGDTEEPQEQGATGESQEQGGTEDLKDGFQEGSTEPDVQQDETLTEEQPEVFTTVDDNLDSSDANAIESSDLSQEQIAIDTGGVTIDELSESKDIQPDINETLEQPENIQETEEEETEEETVEEEPAEDEQSEEELSGEEQPEEGQSEEELPGEETEEEDSQTINEPPSDQSDTDESEVEINEDFEQDLQDDFDQQDEITIAPDIPEGTIPDDEVIIEPDLGDIIEEGTQENKFETGKMNLIFNN
jgi:hypothetical protein